MVQVSHPYMTTGETIALTIWNFVSKVISLLLNMLSRFVIAFLPKEQASFNFMAAFTVCSLMPLLLHTFPWGTAPVSTALTDFHEGLQSAY